MRRTASHTRSRGAIKALLLAVLAVFLLTSPALVMESSAYASGSNLTTKKRIKRIKRKIKRKRAQRKRRSTIYRTPELDPSASGQVAVLLLGGLMLLERRRKRQP